MPSWPGPGNARALKARAPPAALDRRPAIRLPTPAPPAAAIAVGRLSLELGLRDVDGGQADDLWRQKARRYGRQRVHAAGRLRQVGRLQKQDRALAGAGDEMDRAERVRLHKVPDLPDLCLANARLIGFGRVSSQSQDREI